jgi:hypothetical protein
MENRDKIQKLIEISKVMNAKDEYSIGDSTTWKNSTLSKLTNKGLDFEIQRLSKMITPKSSPSIIHQKIKILKEEKAKRNNLK